MPLNRLLLILAIALSASALSVWGAARIGALDSASAWLLLVPLTYLAWRFFIARFLRTGKDRDRPDS
jgi:quinol-cytochrome oxidoreductase complex cytochrome b subunit